jgi:phage N-6-adenine-methyltransferase
MEGMNMSKMDIHFSSAKSDWETPRDFFDAMNAKYGPFDLDVCANKINAKCQNYYSLEENHDGLKFMWHGKNWMNPPYGNAEHPCKKNCKKKRCVKRGSHTLGYIPGIKDWVRKALLESQKGCMTVALLPARTDTKWFHKFIYGQKNVEIIFLEGRLKFVGAKDAAPFPSMVVIFRPE